MSIRKVDIRIIRMLTLSALGMTAAVYQRRSCRLAAVGSRWFRHRVQNEKKAGCHSSRALLVRRPTVPS